MGVIGFAETVGNGYTAGVAMTNAFFVGTGALGAGFGMGMAIEAARRAGGQGCGRRARTRQFFTKDALLGLLRDTAVCESGKMMEKIAADPPDPNFQTVAPATFWSPEYDGEPADPLVDSLGSTVGSGRALLTALERYQGALAAQSPQHEHAQARALSDNTYLFVDSLYDAVDALRAFADEHETEGDIFNAPPFSSQAEKDLVVALHDRVRDAGFTAEELAAMADAGVPQVAIDDFRAKIGSDDLSGVPLDDSLITRMRDAAQGIEDKIEDIESFARHASAVSANVDPGSGGGGGGGGENVPPIADAGGDLEVDQSIGLFPFSGHLSSDSDGTIASYTWHWDDGTPDDVAEFASVGHHLSVGVHAVQLTVTDNEGASDTDTITVTVNNVAPYVFAEDSVRVPPAVGRSYSASVSDAGGSEEITGVIWDFADGTTANGTVVNHTYSTVGQFDVTITATDTFGAVSTKHMAVDVKPVAADAGPDQSRVEGDQVELGGPNSSPADGSVNFVWDFGDGSEPGSGRTASHTFPRNGTYTVTQTATDEGGTATDRAVITVANADPVIERALRLGTDRGGRARVIARGCDGCGPRGRAHVHLELR